MDRRTFMATTAGGLFAAPLAAGAQQTGKVWRIGYLSPGDPSQTTTLLEAFRRSLRELGYVEGRNLTIESRYAEGDFGRLASLAAELIRLEVAVIVAWGPSIRVARDATSTIPIVMASTIDAVEDGFITSLARPGGNVTGLTLISTELMGKRLEMVREALPGVTRLAILVAPPGGISTPSIDMLLKGTEAAAKSLGFLLQVLRVNDPTELDAAFVAMARQRSSALYVVENPLLYVHRARILEQAARRRVPTMFGVRSFVELGGLMAYGPNREDMYRQAAIYVDKILKGSKPADLPVEQPTKFELIINMKTAKALGVTIPPSLLLRADQVIQ